MEFLIGFFGLLYIAYRLADEKWTASMIKHNEQANIKADEQRRQKWLSLVVDEGLEKSMSERVKEWQTTRYNYEYYREIAEKYEPYKKHIKPEDEELSAEIREAETQYGSIINNSMYAVDALLANRGVIRGDAANNGIDILVGGRNMYYQLVNFYLKLNEVLKDHGIDDELYCDMGGLDPFEKAEDLLTRDPEKALGLKLRWRSSLSCYERYSSDLRREMRHDTTGYFNDYLKPF